MRQAEIRLRGKLLAELHILAVEQHGGIQHARKMVLDLVAEVAAVRHTRKVRDLILAEGGQPLRKRGGTVLAEVTLEDERKTEAVFIAEHQIIMRAAEALLIGLDADVGLHHRRPQNGVGLLLLQSVVQRAERTAAALVGGGGVKRLVDGDGIDLLHAENLRNL